MFKFIGGAVVCGLALYGLMKYLERPALKLVINPEVPRKPERAEGEGAVAYVVSSTDAAQPERSDAEAAPAAA
jgi:hypothetical protein